MAPETRASRKMRAASEQVNSEETSLMIKYSTTEGAATEGTATEGTATEGTATEGTATGQAKQESAGDVPSYADELDDEIDAYINSLSHQRLDFMFWALEIEKKIMEEAVDPDSVFFMSGTLGNRGEDAMYYYYIHSDALFLVQDNGQPWRWPIVEVSPTRLGMPYDPETNAADAALNLTIALPQEQLYSYAVYIKDLISPVYVEEGQDMPEGWVREMRVLELLSKKHPHPQIVRYLGCRVVDVPGDTAGDAVGGEAKKRVRRITGIVLEKLGRCMNNYDPRAPEFKDVDADVFLKRLENVVLFLHSISLAHNDLKPGNVMLRGNGLPVLIDFESCSPPGTVLHSCGTPDWTETPDDNVSRFEHDLYALRLFRERIHDEKALAKYFRGH